jgi:hypothetical protein
MIRILVVMLSMALSACATPHGLPYTSSSSPQWHMNPDIMDLGVNAITTPPTMPVSIGPR